MSHLAVRRARGWMAAALALPATVLLAGCSRHAPAPDAALDATVADLAQVSPEERTAFDELGQQPIEGFDKLSPERQASVVSRANRGRCDCGCVGHSINACLHQDETCEIARRVAGSFVDDALAAQMALAGAPADAPDAGVREPGVHVEVHVHPDAEDPGPRVAPDQERSGPRVRPPTGPGPTPMVSPGEGDADDGGGASASETGGSTAGAPTVTVAAPGPLPVGTIVVGGGAGIPQGASAPAGTSTSIGPGTFTPIAPGGIGPGTMAPIAPIGRLPGGGGVVSPGLSGGVGSVTRGGGATSGTPPGVVTPLGPPPAPAGASAGPR